MAEGESKSFGELREEYLRIVVNLHALATKLREACGGDRSRLARSLEQAGKKDLIWSPENLLTLIEQYPELASWKRGNLFEMLWEAANGQQ